MGKTEFSFSSSVKGGIVIRQGGHVIVLTSEDIRKLNDLEWTFENLERDKRNSGNVYKG